MDTQLINASIAGTAGVLGGCVSALVTARLKMRELGRASEVALRSRVNQERARCQLQYLNPLRVQAEDLRRRLIDVDSRELSGDSFLRDTIQEIEPKARGPLEDFTGWANGVGQYALSTVYMTLCYLAGASRVRADLPHVDLGFGNDRSLLEHLEPVRRAIGGEYGIWDSLQDSLGRYVRDNEGNQKDYRQFCTDLTPEGGFVWIDRVLGFYATCISSRRTNDEKCASGCSVR